MIAGEGVVLDQLPPGALVALAALLGLVQPGLDVLASRAGVVAGRQPVDVLGALGPPVLGLVGQARADVQRDARLLHHCGPCGEASSRTRFVSASSEKERRCRASRRRCRPPSRADRRPPRRRPADRSCGCCGRALLDPRDHIRPGRVAEEVRVAPEASGTSTGTGRRILETMRPRCPRPRRRGRCRSP